MDTVQTKPGTKNELQLNLLLSDSTLAQRLWSSLVENAAECFFPKKLPPLLLTSRPLPVREIWGPYDYRKNGLLGSMVVHVLALGAIVCLTALGRNVVQRAQKPQMTMALLAPDDIPPLPIPKTKVGGGGGGGDCDKLQASKGKLPKLAMQQIVPPMAVVRNESPKLSAEPTVVVPPEIILPSNNLPSLGDPLSNVLGPPSNGPGSGGGIGSGSGGGVGSGEGPGVGPGHGGGIGGGVFRVGAGISAPRPIFAPDPEYSEEARRAKYQGTCILWLVIDRDGKPRDIRVMQSLGLGLDEKAVEAVKLWKFEPAKKDGKLVAVEVNVELTFRLY